MGRKRKRDTSSTTASTQNSSGSLGSSGRTVKDRPAPGDLRTPAATDSAERNPWVLAAVCTVLLLSTILAFRLALDRNFGFVNCSKN